MAHPHISILIVTIGIVCLVVIFKKSTEVTPSINHRVSRGNVPHGDRSTRVAHKKRVGALKGRNCRCLT